MLSAAFKALAQLPTPPFRRVLLKSIGLGLIFIILVSIALFRVFRWMAEGGSLWVQQTTGAAPDGFLGIIATLLSIMAGLGIVTGAVFLMPAVTAFVGSFFVDEIAEHVERAHYPTDQPGVALPLPRALLEGSKTALLALAVYVVALPFVFFAGLGLIVLFVANAYLLSREYFDLAAMRFRSVEDAKAFRRAHRGTVFAAGFFIAAFVSIPIVNLATPLFAMALMVHLHKQLSPRQVTAR